MPSPLRRWPRRAASAVLALLAVIGVLAFTGSTAAFAHAVLLDSTPSASSVLETSPPLIALHFDENIDTPLTSIQLFDQDSKPITIGQPQRGVDGSYVQSTVPNLADGTFAVVWRVSSADGHVVSGAFSFQVGTKAAGVDAGKLIDTVLNGARAEPAVGRALGLARFTSFLGIALLLGGFVMVMMVAADAEIGWAAQRLLWIGWLLAIVGAAANFGLLGANAAAGSLSDAFKTSLWHNIGNTRTGELLLARLLLLALVLPLIGMIRKRETTWWRIAMPLVTLLMVFTFSASGHPSVEQHPALWIGVDALHLGLIFLWLGGLAMMAVGGRDWLRETGHERAVRGFSKIATVGVPLIVVTGVVQAWKIGGGFSTLTNTSWGRILLAKGAAVVLLVTIGGASRWLLRHDGAASIRRTVTTETLVGVAVLGLAAGLVGVPPKLAVQSRIYSASLTEAGIIVETSISPGQVGGNEVHMIVTPPGGGIAPVTSLTARVTLPSKKIPAIPVTLVAEAPNHYSGNITLPYPGDWTLEIIVEPSPGSTVLMSGTVSIPNPRG